MTNIQSEDADKEGGEWEEAFDKLCIVTVDGKCKYWRPESFGYSELDAEAPLDKFFPEEIKNKISIFLLATRSQAFEEGRAEERKRVVEMMKKITTVHQPLNFQKKPVREGETTAYCGGCDRFVIEAGCLCGMVSIDDLEKLFLIK